MVKPIRCWFPEIAKVNFLVEVILRGKCPYMEFFWVVFSCIWNECGDVLCKSPYSVRMWENKDQESSSYGNFLWSLNLEMYYIIVSYKFLRYYPYIIPQIVFTSQKDWNKIYKLMGYCRNSSLHVIFEFKPEFCRKKICRIL